MIAHCEANQAWLENITYQMTLMPYKQQSAHLAGPIGLLKMFATRSAHEIADEAVQIFGGRALTQTGMGRTIEMFHRTYKFDAILGGAEGRFPSLSYPKAELTDTRGSRGSWCSASIEEHAKEHAVRYGYFETPTMSFLHILRGRIK